jgi:hypothetical protein
MEMTRPIRAGSLRPGTEDAIEHLVSIVSEVEESVLFITCVDDEGRVGESECFVSATEPLEKIPLEALFHLPLRLRAPSVLVTSRSTGFTGSPAEGDVDLARRIVEKGKACGVDVYEHVLVGDNDTHCRLSQVTDLWT